MFLFAFLWLKIIDFIYFIIQWFYLSSKTLSVKFRRELDTMLCFESKILKS